MYIRTLAIILLSALLTATSQSAAKEPSKDISKEPKWPDKIGDKNLSQWLRTAIIDPDPSVRGQAIQAIPNFSPAEVRKTCAQQLCKRLDSGGEQDPGVKIALIDLIGAIGIEDTADVKEALRLLLLTATSNTGSVNRLHTLQAIEKFGTKAHSVARSLATSEFVIKDPSYEVRRVVAHTLGRISYSESDGPNYSVLKQLSNTMAKDPCLPVRLEALESIFILGPPWDLEKKSGEKNVPPAIDDKAAQEISGHIESRITGAKAPETSKQAELWCRLVIIRFGTQEDMKKQVNAIAANLLNGDDAVKYQTLFALRLLGDNVEPKMIAITNILNSRGSPPILREAALLTLGAIGEKAFDPIKKVIEDTKEEPEIRIAALKALAMLGEKAEKARGVVVAIIQDDTNLKDPTNSRIALLEQALLTLAAMGVKAQSEVPVLQDLSKQLVVVKEKRLKGDDYQKWLKNPETQKYLNRFKPEERDDMLNNQNPEDQFKRFVDEAIEYIKRSTDGHPGGPPAKK